MYNTDFMLSHNYADLDLVLVTRQSFQPYIIPENNTQIDFWSTHKLKLFLK